MAGSIFAPAASTIIRRGRKLIFPAPMPGQPVVLPPVCVRCGGAGSAKPVEKTYYWHHPALYVLLISPLIYVIVALIVRKSMKVRFSLCVHHAQRRSIGVTLAWVLPVIGVADAFILPRFDVDTVIVVLVVSGLLIAGLVIWAVVNSPIRPTSIEKDFGEFSGFSEVFLQQFPQDSLQPVAFAQQQFPPPPVG